MKKLLYLVLLLCSCMLHAAAQSGDKGEQRDIYETARNYYEIGKIEEARQLLKDNIHSFSGSVLQSAYRILTFCDLALDNDAEAEEYARLLLAENPYYSPTLNDSQRFIDMVERLKSGISATITTASSQAETLSEVTVPTTLITADMIHACGGSNLQEVLAAYVPGMNIVDGNDDINIAMRGIYSNSQEKILIMLNGHRLNSYCTNIAAPDYSIGLEKIKQIEVLRGPASSLYGGVSLTAVVNIITWQGADIEGVKLKAGMGNYGQLRADAMMGKRYFDVDFLLWGSIYRAKGEKRYVDRSETALDFTSGDVTIGGIGNKPSYDVGVNLKYKDVSFMYNARFSQIQAPMAMMFFYAPYDIEKYKTFNGIRPSYTTASHHGDISYSKQLGKVWLKGTATYDNGDLTHYQVISEEPTSAIVRLLPIPEIFQKQVENQPGLFRYINGQENTVGIKLQGDWSYVSNKSHKGNLSLGSEYTYFKLDDVRYSFGYGYNKMLPEPDTIAVLGRGHESNLNAFVQLKHQWKNFILNAGLRYDYKARYDDSHIREFSPRVALIYMQPKWNVKLSYSKSFIDAPYLYRKSNLVLANYLYQEYLPETLMPEALHSSQFTFNAVEWIKGLNFEINAFYNRANDLIFQMFADHSNRGEMHSYGLEFSGSYRMKNFNTHLNATWQDVNRNRIFDLNFDRPLNTPRFIANAVLTWNTPLKNLELHTHLQFYSKQEAYHLDPISYDTWIGYVNYYGKLLKEDGDNITPEIEEEIIRVQRMMDVLYEDITVQKDYPARLQVNLGAKYSIDKLELRFDVHNLFNHKYYQSGMSTGLIPQKGLWFMGSIAYKF